jgi:hypothetical protein
MLREDWVPIKLDVSIEMPDLLDISTLRGNGPQAGEELLPEPKIQPPAPVMDEAVLSQLADMGKFAITIRLYLPVTFSVIFVCNICYLML